MIQGPKNIEQERGPTEAFSDQYHVLWLQRFTAYVNCVDTHYSSVLGFLGANIY